MHDIKDFHMGLFSLKGKNALVTGGNSGLGQGFATALAKAGANVMAVSLVDDEGETQKIIEECGVKYKLALADITAPGECKRVVEDCVKTFGSIDILVNCAGRILVVDISGFYSNHGNPRFVGNYKHRHVLAGNDKGNFSS